LISQHYTTARSQNNIATNIYPTSDVKRGRKNETDEAEAQANFSIKTDRK